jgi:type I restriction enzyme R subunit
LSLFFDDLLDAKVREFNPRYAETGGALPGQFHHLHTDIHGNREFVEHLRNRGKFFDHEEKRERDLILIDYDDPARNVYEVTEEWAFHNGHYCTREDVVFLINGIPVLVIECRNANKDEAIAPGVDQIRRYHRETPELFVSQQLFTATDAIGFSYGVSWNTVRRIIFNWKLTENGFSNPLSGKGGQECPPSGGSPFFNPYGEIDKTTHHLPHWQQGETWVFVTWRLVDSLPKAKLDQWKAEREAWLKHHPEPWNEETEAEYHERFSRQIDEWLDQGSGSCVLKDPANAKIVSDALRHFDGDRYELASFVVMPNHVHVLFRPLGPHSLPEILKSWKGFTAREINKRIGKAGTLWQDEYWDRLIRNERHFFKVAEYIRENPVKAKLRDGQFILESGLSSPLGSSKGGQECPPSFQSGLENPPSVDVPGRLEDKVKSFCAIPQVIAFLKDYIVFAAKDADLNKYILRQHQSGTVDAAVAPSIPGAPAASSGYVSGQPYRDK